MMVKLVLSNTSIADFYLKRAVPWINKALELRKKTMEEMSPTDTGNYIRSHKIEEAVVAWGRAKWANVNDSEHAFWVEYWFRKSPVNRHKWPPRNSSTVIYNGVGASVMRRAVEVTKKDVVSLIVDSINQWLNR